MMKQLEIEPGRHQIQITIDGKLSAKNLRLVTEIAKALADNPATSNE
jgi:hypothetical protein